MENIGDIIMSLDMKERSLFSRLKGIKENPTKKEALKQYDRFNLLEEV